MDPGLEEISAELPHQIENRGIVVVDEQQHCRHGTASKRKSHPASAWVAYTQQAYNALISPPLSYKKSSGVSDLFTKASILWCIFFRSLDDSVARSYASSI
jgi:hypothetical protein